MNWLNKYRPNHYDDIKIQLNIKKKMEEWLQLFINRNTDYKFLYLYGSPGCGKTTMANLLLSKYNYDILEWNVIDLKQNKNIDETINKVINRQNINILIKQKKVSSAIILEECDCLSNSGKEIISNLTKKFDNLEDIVPIICTSNELEDYTKNSNIKNSYNLFFEQLTKKDIMNIYLHIKSNENIYIDNIIEDTLLKCLFDKLDTDLRQWLIHLENIVNLYYNNHSNQYIIEKLDRFYNYWSCIEKKNKYYTNYEIVSSLYNQNLDNNDLINISNGEKNNILPMMCYTNLDNIYKYKNKSNDDFKNFNNYLAQRKRISKQFIYYEKFKNYKNNFLEDRIYIIAIIYILFSINYFIKCVYNSKTLKSIAIINKDNIPFPSIIYNKKYTECTHRKMISYITMKYNVSYEFIKFLTYYMYMLYNNKDVIQSDKLLINFKEDIKIIDINDIEDILKCDFLKDDIQLSKYKHHKQSIILYLKKLFNNNIISNDTNNHLNINIVNNSIDNNRVTDNINDTICNKKKRGRPSKYIDNIN